MARRKWQTETPKSRDILFRDIPSIPGPGRTAPRGDHGPPERWRHSGRLLETTGHAGVLAARVSEEHALDRLRLRGLIGARDHEAGLRLRADYHAAHLEGRIIASYNAARGMNCGGFQAYERTDIEEAAYRRWRGAVQAVGIADSAAVLGLCCHGHGPRAAQMAALRRGLSRLAAWYGLPQDG
ncbi:MAG: DUF6456 domain-containing protein [Alphaproteobacteria bacterium]